MYTYKTLINSGGQIPPTLYLQQAWGPEGMQGFQVGGRQKRVRNLQGVNHQNDLTLPNQSNLTNLT